MKQIIKAAAAVTLVMVFTGCSEPLTTREKGAGIGTLTGAGLGAIIGSATGNAGAGAGIGAAVGLVGGAVIGDQMQAQQKQDAAVQQAPGAASRDRAAAKRAQSTQSAASALAVGQSLFDHKTAR